MNKLKKYAGLLNDEAPKDHFLAYITPNERDMLVNAGGSGKMTPQGIPSFYAGEFGGMDFSDSSAGSEGDSDYGGGGGGDDIPDDTGTEGAGTHGSGTGADPDYNIDTSYGDDMNYTLEQQRQTQIARNIAQGKDPYYNPMLDDIGMEGSITKTIYDPKTKTFKHEQAPGTIKAIEYQKSNLKTYLESPDVSDEDKIGILNQLQAIQNSQLVGTAQGKYTGAIDDQDIATDWVLNNLTGSLDYVKGMSNLNKYTSKIDKDSLTFQKQIQNDGIIKTVLKSGGIIGTMFKGLTDSYKNKQAMKLLGYSTRVWNPETQSFGSTPSKSNVGEEDTATQAISSNQPNTSPPPLPDSMVDKYFANLNNTNLGINQNYLNTYNTAKANIANTLNMTPNTQQYGYGNTFNDNYARSMTSANPFFEELTSEGLI